MIGGVAHLPLWGSQSVCMCQHHVPWEIVIHETWCWLRQAPTLLFLFIFILFWFFNCTLQYTWIIVEYSVIVGRSMVWLETNLNPTMTILLLFFPQFYRPSDNYRAERVRGQFDSVRKVWCLGCRVQIMRRWYLTATEETSKWWTGQIVTARECPHCDSQKVQHQAPSTEQLLYSRLVLPPYTVKIREDVWKELLRWALVLPPNTVNR